MPIFRTELDNVPAWSELRHYEAHELHPEASVSVRRTHECENIVATYGTGQVVIGGQSLVLAEGQFVAVPAGVRDYTLRGTWRPASFMRLCGLWGSEVGGCGVFRANPGEGPKNVGDPVDYPKISGVDRHYHDYDAVPGSCWTVQRWYTSIRRVCRDTQRLCRHRCGPSPRHCLRARDVPRRGTSKALCADKKRIGHLWNYKHGAAVPDPERA